METKIIKKIQTKTKNEFKKGRICWMNKASFWICLTFILISIILLIIYLTVTLSNKWSEVILAISSGILTGIVVALTFEIINGKKTVMKQTREYNDLLRNINEQYGYLASHNPNLDALLVNILVLDNDHNKSLIKNMSPEDRKKVVNDIIKYYKGHCENIPQAKKVLKNIMLGLVDPLKNLNRLLPLFMQRYSSFLTPKERMYLQDQIWNTQHDKNYVDGVYKDSFAITVDPITRIIKNANKVIFKDSFFIQLLMPEFKKQKSKLTPRNDQNKTEPKKPKTIAAPN